MTFLLQRLARVAPFYWIMSIAVFSVALVGPSRMALRIVRGEAMPVFVGATPVAAGDKGGERTDG